MTRDSGWAAREYHNGEVEKYLSTCMLSEAKSRSFNIGERDQETGLDYRGARFYDADVGRFLSLDPLAAKYPSLSDYCYVAGNPLVFTDPDGKRIKVKRTKDNVVKLKFTARLTNISSVKLTRKEMKIHKNEIKTGINSYWTGQGENISWKTKTKIKISKRHKSNEKRHSIVIADATHKDIFVLKTEKTGEIVSMDAAVDKIGGNEVVIKSDILNRVDSDGIDDGMAYDPIKGDRIGRTLGAIAAHEFGHLGNLEHADAGKREGDIMHQASNKLAGNNVHESEVLKIENFTNEKN